MINAETLIAALSLAAWLWLLLARGNFWLTSRERRQKHSLETQLTSATTQKRSSARDLRAKTDELGNPSSVPACDRVIAVMPARNEAEFIALSVKSLLASGIRVVVVDDHSSDGTAEITRAAAAESGTPDRLTVIRAKPLPAGWSGKLWAMHQGVQEALSTPESPPLRSEDQVARNASGPLAQLPPEFLLFTDADVVHTAETLRGLLGIANRGYDLVSFMVKLQCRTLAEKLLIPAFVFFFFMLYPPAWISKPSRRTAGAAGGCILIRPEALARAGGLEAIRNEIIDDCALARAVKQSGGRLWLGLSENSTSLRPYRSFAEIGRMISRTAFNQLRHSTWLLLATLIGLGIAYAAPPLLLFATSGLSSALAGLAWAAMTVAYFPMVRFYRLWPAWGLSLPLAAIFYAGASVYSAWLYWSGRGGRWKGRAQDAPTSKAASAEADSRK